jgi:hypothetical protein
VGGWGDGWAAAPAGARPQGRRGVYGGGYRVGGLLVVHPPADEICPRVGGVAFDGKVDLAHPADRVEELLVAQADSVAGIELLGNLEAHRPRDLAEAQTPAQAPQERSPQYGNAP